MQATIYSLQGQPQGTVELNDAIYGIEPNTAVVHQAVLRQQANARLGTHNTLTRADVSGGGKKPWRQKGTGRARQGSTRAPQWRHGGVVFGPHPRSYVQDLPRKMRRLAMRSVLSSKAADGRILLVDSFGELEPRTKAMVTTLQALRLDARRVLIMTPGRIENLELAAGNLPNVTRMHTHFLNLVEMLKAEVLVMDRASVEVIESILGQTGGRASRPLEAPEGAPARLATILEPAVADSTPDAGVVPLAEPVLLPAGDAESVPVALGATVQPDTLPADETLSAASAGESDLYEGEDPASGTGAFGTPSHDEEEGV